MCYSCFQIDKPSALDSSQVLCLLVALVQTIYMTLSFQSWDSGRARSLSSLGWTSETSLAQSKNIWLLSYRVAEVCDVN